MRTPIGASPSIDASLTASLNVRPGGRTSYPVPHEIRPLSTAPPAGGPRIRLGPPTGRGSSLWRLSCLLTLLLLSACDSADDDELKLIQYTGPPVTEEDMDRGLHWVATADTVFRQVRLEGIDEELGEVVHRFDFQEDPGRLPLLLSYWYKPDSDQGARLISGTIYIQDFALNGQISGRFEGSLYSGLKVGSLFWADASAENVAAVPVVR